MTTGRGTKTLHLAYGRTGLPVELPLDTDVIEPTYVSGLPDEEAAIRDALRSPIGKPPLRDLVSRGSRIGIVVCDVTRPFPGRRVLPVVLRELDQAGANRVTVYIATGTHRVCTDAELMQMLGPTVLARCRVVQHDASDREAHSQVGVVPGTDVPVLIQSSFLDEDVRITTGFVEPHFFAGFSGGPKMVAPGLAALETVLELHSATRIAAPTARWGVTVGNPIHDAVREIARRVGVTFSVDVTINRDHGITGVFAGDLAQAHVAGCRFAGQKAMVDVPEPYDVVITTNSGYPLDQNLYQSVKGLSAAAQIVKPGGSIVLAAECSDGLPDHGRYKDLLREAGGPEEFLLGLDGPGPGVHDQWQVQIQAQIQRNARVFVKSDGLSPEQIRAAWLEPISDVGACVDSLAEAARGKSIRVAALPQGPQTIPRVHGS